jgi:hypothetical protein
MARSSQRMQEAHCIQHRMQRVTGLSLQLELAAVPSRDHSEMAYDGFYGLPTPEPAPLHVGQGLEAAAVNDLDARIVRVHAPES